MSTDCDNFDRNGGKRRHHKRKKGKLPATPESILPLEREFDSVANIVTELGTDVEAVEAEVEADLGAVEPTGSTQGSTGATGGNSTADTVNDAGTAEQANVPDAANATATTGASNGNSQGEWWENGDPDDRVVKLIPVTAVTGKIGDRSTDSTVGAPVIFVGDHEQMPDEILQHIAQVSFACENTGTS